MIEFFWYGCQHCHALEAELGPWLRGLPDYVEFIRVPVLWGAEQEAHARLFYTLRALRREDLDQRVFELIHQQKNRLVAGNPGETFRLHLAFATGHGIGAQEFSRAYRSKSVDTGIERARRLTKACRITSVPSMVVDGKYLTSAGRAGGKRELLGVVSALVQR